MSSTLSSESTRASTVPPVYPSLTTTNHSLTLTWGPSPERPWLTIIVMLCVAAGISGVMMGRLIYAGVAPNWDDYSLLFVLTPLAVAFACYSTWAGHYTNFLRICTDGTLTLGANQWRASRAPTVRAVDGASKAGKIYAIALGFSHQALVLPSFPDLLWRNQSLAQIEQWLATFFPVHHQSQPQLQQKPLIERGLLALLLTGAVAFECLVVLLWGLLSSANTTPDLHSPLAPATVYLLLAAWIMLTGAWWLAIVPAKQADLIAEPRTVGWISAMFLSLLIAATYMVTFVGQRHAAATTPGTATIWLAHPHVSSAKHCSASLTVKDPQTGQIATSCNLALGSYDFNGAPIEVRRITNRYGTTDTLLRMASAPG
jgi:hypothetical protein